MQIAILTGSAGFVGQNVVRRLLNSGVQVIGLDYRCTPEQEAQDGFMWINVANCSYTEIMMELQNLNLDKDETVFYHFAWAFSSGVGQTLDEPQLSNVQTSIEYAKICKMLQLSKFVFIDSIISKELAFTMLNPHATAKSKYAYAAAKYCAKVMTQNLFNDTPVVFCVMSLAQVYAGDDLTGNFVSKYIRLMKEGAEIDFSSSEQLRDFVHVTDVAQAAEKIGARGENNFDYWVGSGNAQPLKNFILEMNRATGDKGTLNFGAIKTDEVSMPLSVFDISDLRKIGYEPSVKFSEGVRAIFEDK
ncbi:MAG: NAD(P)-dependent oxidoreductase [Candidatus Ancillula sp.]|jgi:nucleoside-diphosphate-sugar epimerase|nr:NAD(P)-dependent oxidoreductase [Candidatus Ancillula sp.]